MSAKRKNAVANDKFGWANGIPPVAHKVVAVDFDETIFPWGELMDQGKQPIDGAATALQLLKDYGYRIVILTSRLSSQWLIDEWDDPDLAREEQVEYITAMLNNWAIPFDEITAEKGPSEAIFDDKAWRVTRRQPLLWAVAEFLNERGLLDGSQAG